MTRRGACPHHGEHDQRWDPEAGLYLCPECVARATQPRGYITEGDIAEAAGFMRPEAVEE